MWKGCFFPINLRVTRSHSDLFSASCVIMQFLGEVVDGVFYLKWTNLMKNVHLIMRFMQSGELRSSTFGGQQMLFIKFAFTLRADCPERVAQNSSVWTFAVFWGWSVPMGLFASADHKVWQGPGPYDRMPQSLNRLSALLELSWRRHVCTTTSSSQLVHTSYTHFPIKVTVIVIIPKPDVLL